MDVGFDLLGTTTYTLRISVFTSYFKNSALFRLLVTFIDWSFRPTYLIKSFYFNIIRIYIYIYIYVLGNMFDLAKSQRHGSYKGTIFMTHFSLIPLYGSTLDEITWFDRKWSFVQNSTNADSVVYSIKISWASVTPSFWELANIAVLRCDYMMKYIPVHVL